MKTHHTWKESINEKFHFIHSNNYMNATNDSYQDRYSAHNSHKPINFFCAAPRAKLVELVGDFNHWKPLPMSRSIDGWWLAQVELTHGHHRYRFVVDGQPVLDPNSMGTVHDDADERASLIAVS